MTREGLLWIGQHPTSWLVAEELQCPTTQLGPHLQLALCHVELAASSVPGTPSRNVPSRCRSDTPVPPLASCHVQTLAPCLQRCELKGHGGPDHQQVLQLPLLVLLQRPVQLQRLGEAQGFHPELARLLLLLP